MRCNLERELASKLPNARAVGNIRRDDHARRASTIDGAIGVFVVDVVEHIEGICSQLEPHPLGNSERLPNTEVHIEEVWPIETVPEVLAERTGRGVDVRGRIKPLTRSVMAHARVGIADLDGIKRAAPARA